MKILHINTFDTGGAAIAAIRLHMGLLAEGIDSNVLFLHQSNKNIPNSCQFSVPKKSYAFKILNYLKINPSIAQENIRKIVGRPLGFEPFSFGNTGFNIIKHSSYKEADIINLHWTSRFLDYNFFFSNNTKPVVWTLHDINPFSGGCHYQEGCNKFIDNCEKCFQLRGTINEQNALINLEFKMHSLSNYTDLHIVTLSKWLQKCSVKSKLFGKYFHYNIPNGLNMKIYKIRDLQFSKSLFNISSDKKVILFLSSDINNRRKGFDLLLEAIKQIDTKEKFIVCIAGKIKNHNIHNNIHYIGNLTDELLISCLFSAADVFVLPSREDNLPNTMLEAMACGTPVISFPVGGMLDVIKTGFNGILTKEVSVEALTKAIQDFINGEYSFDRKEIRNFAIKHFDQSVQAKAYIDLYKRILAEKRIS